MDCLKASTNSTAHMRIGTTSTATCGVNTFATGIVLIMIAGYKTRMKKTCQVKLW